MSTTNVSANYVLAHLSAPAVGWATSVADITQEDGAIKMAERATIWTCLLGLCAEFVVALYHFLTIFLLPLTALLAVIAMPFFASPNLIPWLWELLFNVHAALFIKSLAGFKTMWLTLSAYCSRGPQVNLVPLVRVPARFTDVLHSVNQRYNWKSIWDVKEFVADVSRSLGDAVPGFFYFPVIATHDRARTYITVGAAVRTFGPLPSQQELLQWILTTAAEQLQQNFLLQVTIPDSLRGWLNSAWLATPPESATWGMLQENFLRPLERVLKTAISRDITITLEGEGNDTVVLVKNTHSSLSFLDVFRAPPGAVEKNLLQRIIDVLRLSV